VRKVRKAKLLMAKCKKMNENILFECEK